MVVQKTWYVIPAWENFILLLRTSALSRWHNEDVSLQKMVWLSSTYRRILF